MTCGSKSGIEPNPDRLVRMEVRLIAAQDYTHRDHRLLGQRNIVRQTTASNHRRIVSRKLLWVESYGAPGWNRTSTPCGTRFFKSQHEIRKRQGYFCLYCSAGNWVRSANCNRIWLQGHSPAGQSCWEQEQ